MSRSRVLTVVVTALLVLVILAPKIEDFGTWTIGPDGSIYMNVATHLRMGEGLTTSLAVYHQGYAHFPHPTPVQPLWPLVLAFSSLFTPMVYASTWVPSLLWALSLVLAFVWGRRVVPPKPDGLIALHGGHAVVACLGLSPFYLSFGSRPYTEALSFALLFGLFLRAQGLWRRRRRRDGVELGVWLALLFLTRSQLVVVPLAAFVLVLWHLVREPQRRRQTAVFGVVVVVSFALVMLPELLWIGSFCEGSALGTYLRFDQSGSSALSDVSGLRVTGSPWETLVDRAGGFVVAFTPDEDGYKNVFGFFIYVVPVAVVAVVDRVARDARAVGRDVAAFVDDHGTAAVTGVGAFLLMHVMHKDLGHPWWFGDRHALLVVALIACAFFFCVKCGGVVARVAVALFVVSTLHAAAMPWEHVWGHKEVGRWHGKPYPVQGHRFDAQVWLLSRDMDEPGPLTVALPANEARKLSWLLPDIGMHGLLGETTFDDLSYMVRHLGVQYVLVIDEEPRAWRDDPRFDDHFVEVDRFFSERRRDGKIPNTVGNLVVVYAPVGL